jgi:RPA family protein
MELSSKFYEKKEELEQNTDDFEKEEMDSVDSDVHEGAINEIDKQIEDSWRINTSQGIIRRLEKAKELLKI